MPPSCVAVTYEPLPAVARSRDALAPGAPVLWPQHESNLCVDSEAGDREAVEAAFARAAHVVRLETALNRVTGVPMELRAALGAYDAASGRFTVYTSAGGGVIRQRDDIAGALGVAKDRVRVVSGDVGGNFGIRNNTCPEFVLVAWAAKRVGRPVKWRCERQDAFLSDFHGRDLISRGRTRARRRRAFPRVARRQYQQSRRRRGLVRAAGEGDRDLVRPLSHPGLVHARARRRDQHGADFGLSQRRTARGHVRARTADRHRLPPPRLRPARSAPAQSRAARSDAVPQPARPRIRQRRLPGLACAAPPSLATGPGSRRAGPRRRRRGRCRGIGIATSIELNTGAPRERAEMTIDPSGTVEIVLGTMSAGQGHETSFAQIVSEWLGVDPERVRLVTGDTDRVQAGGGSASARSMRLGSWVIALASDQIVEKGRRIAAALLEAAEADIDFARGRFVVMGTDRSVGLFEAAAAALGDDSPARAARTADRHLRSGHGDPVLRLYLARSARSRSIPRPALSRWSATSRSTIAAGRSTRCWSTARAMAASRRGSARRCGSTASTTRTRRSFCPASLMDYAMPRADLLPSFTTEISEVPSTTNPLGMRGGSEGGITPGLAAVANAIVDALAEFGVEHIELAGHAGARLARDPRRRRSALDGRPTEALG